MDWIKKHTDQFTLAIIAVILLALSTLVFLKAQSFGEGFSAALEKPPRSKEIEPVDTKKIDEAQKQLASPVLWAPKLDSGSLFVSKPMILDKADPTKIVIVGKGTQHPPIPDAWVLKYNLDLLSPTFRTEDPDGDGFTNIEEFVGPDLVLTSPTVGADGDTDSTNPTGKESHSPYHTKLFLKQWVPIPFRLMFQASDGDPAQPDKMTFQINTIDRGRKSEFLPLKATVSGTSWRLERFEKKNRLNKQTNEEEDASELTVKNTETGEEVILVYGAETPTLSPDSYAVFSYLWPDRTKPQDIKVKKRQEFLLRPNIEEKDKFKFIDIEIEKPVDNKGPGTVKGALIQLPGGDKTYSVPPITKDPNTVFTGK
jgi:hypothetical protein